jgi:hypothetical protein
MRMPLPPPPAEALIITGIADLVGDLRPPACRLSMTPRWPGTVETLAAAAAFLDSILSPMAAMAPGVRTDEDDTGGDQRLGEGLALGQEAVAGMDRFGAGLLAGGDDLLDQEIGSRPRPGR